MDKQLKIALPKGKLLLETATLAQAAGWGFAGYTDSARLYNLESALHPGLTAKIFHEKDIPIQVALGNYDLGICGLDWIEELAAKYPGSTLVKVKNLSYGRQSLFSAVSCLSPLRSLTALHNLDKVVLFSSEYPNLSEALALRLRLKRFNIFPVWGAAEIYPPESADVVVIAAKTAADIHPSLTPLNKLLDSSACLIANLTSWQTQDLSHLLGPFFKQLKPVTDTLDPRGSDVSRDSGSLAPQIMDPETVRLALPDGHQQKHTVNLLIKAGISPNDYPSPAGNRRPQIGLPGVSVKVIRPQDMPLLVANGSFDLAVSGKDWLYEHLYKFPASPVVDLLDLGYGKVRIVAAVHGALPVMDMAGLQRYIAAHSLELRIASEYVAIADKYGRDNRLGMYRVIPTWGATEAFLPDDADLLIENTETGTTLARHNLRIIDTLFESTGYLIGNREALQSSKKAKIESLVGLFRRALEVK